MKTTSNLAYIIPAHKLHPGLTAAIDSVLAQSPKANLILVTPKDEVYPSISDARLEKLTLVNAEGDRSFPALVNLGIEAAKGMENVEWISILEYDDALLPYATAVFEKYRDRFDQTPVFAGLTLIVDPGDRTKDQTQPPALQQMANEAAWAPNIMEVPGIVDFNAMLRMNFVLLTSTFIKLEILDEIGNLKQNMKHFSDYEFLLRIVYNGHEIRSIPKATHYHYNNGEALTTLRSLNRDEAEFWVNAARKEYFFEFDRELSYDPVEETETPGS